MPVAAIAMVAAPEYLMKGIAETTASTTHVQTGGCRVGDTLDSAPENGSWLSRAIPKHSRMVDARIDRQQTKIAADTTNRYKVAKPVEKFASMTSAGVHPSFTAVPRLGIATSVPTRNTPPMMNAPITENSTALGAARRGSRVSSASVDAVSNP